RGRRRSRKMPMMEGLVDTVVEVDFLYCLAAVAWPRAEPCVIVSEAASDGRLEAEEVTHHGPQPFVGAEIIKQAFDPLLVFGNCCIVGMLVAVHLSITLPHQVP